MSDLAYTLVGLLLAFAGLIEVLYIIVALHG